MIMIENLLRPTLTQEAFQGIKPQSSDILKEYESLILPDLGGRQEPISLLNSLRVIARPSIPKPVISLQQEKTREAKELKTALSAQGMIAFLKQGEVLPRNRRVVKRRRRRLSCYSPDHGKPKHRCGRSMSLIKH